MNNSHTTSYLNRLLLLTLVFILFSGVAALATVWMRQQISSTASATREMELRLANLERKSARVQNDIAIALNPFFVQEQIRHFGLSLHHPSDRRVVRVTDAAVAAVARERSPETVESSFNIVFARSSGTDANP